jgi:hypothetical protein
MNFELAWFLLRHGGPCFFFGAGAKAERHENQKNSLRHIEMFLIPGARIIAAIGLIAIQG